MSKGTNLEANFVEWRESQQDHRPPYLERRHSERIPIRLAFDVYVRFRYVGRYWSSDASHDGVFLKADDADPLMGTILNLHFNAEGTEQCLQGIAVRAVQGKGVGVQLAIWRSADRAAYASFLRLIGTRYRAPMATGGLAALTG
jgi:hypothetical protein